MKINTKCNAFIVRGITTTFLTLLMTACASTPQDGSTAAGAETTVATVTKSAADTGGGGIEPGLTAAHGDVTNGVSQGRKSELIKGSGRFFDAQAARKSIFKTRNGEYNLKFEDAKLSEVVKTIMGDILGLNYTMDEKIVGQVFMQTGNPLAKEDLLPALETLLSRYGAVIISEGGMYSVVPEATGLSTLFAPQSNLLTDRGYQNIIIPLRYIAAEEMRKILESLHTAKKGVVTDQHRNLLMVSGTPADLREYLRTVEVFDIDQMDGMSVGLFRLEVVEVKAVKRELEAILEALAGESGRQMVRLLEIERINSLLAISPQPKYLRDIDEWIDRLDRAELTAGRGMYVYFVQNGDASKMASVLQQLTTGGRSTGSPVPRPLRAEAGVAELEQRAPAVNQAANAAGAAGAPSVAAPKQVMFPGSGPANEAATISISEVNIIADEERNALVILATPEEYAQVEKAIRKLDITPNQVLVEASIIEVTLTDEFSFGLEWFFRNNRGSKTGTTQLDLGAAGIAAIVPGFSYSLVDAADKIGFVLNALAADTRLNVISSPSLMVLDNKTATITVGDQVPIRTSETVSQGTSGDNPVITSSIQFRDTGVTLEVTPRINNGGKVIMDIRQEVSSVDRTTTSSIDSPTINQREIKTSVAIQSGETIVLGGLIQDDKQNSESGLPGIRKVPVIGWFFGAESETNTRTELLVLITPTAILDDSDARAATEELKGKMKGLERVNYSVR
ncbi:type II secretion system secretin GspD [Sedimenticola selenatireducens]|uniref:Type II secretion system protein GspD n=1 Tax=Sedimenticola selenatireducens TaxID=191960 RepID=A0A2N6CST0_9GAMM|nr:type II secretion system secretin GspD [Sedimenticola selenatireducens]PLX60157.1 MAG: type II secretion system protein GspD [Sedimenticola selenatireducens]